MLSSSAFIFQHKELSTITWVILILLILFVLILNYSLFSAFRNRNKPGSGTSVLQRFLMSIKEPDRNDEKMRDELNERVKRLSKQNPPPKDE